MRVEHELDVVGICPENDLPDFYRVIVRTTTLIRAEDVLAHAQRLLEDPVHQERFTVALAAALRTEVETVCFHGPVRTRCVVGGPQ